MENNESFKMEPPVDYFYNDEGREWSQKHNWVNTEDKTLIEVLIEISNQLSDRINWKSTIHLMEQAKTLLFMQFEDGENTTLYNDMEKRIDSISDCEKYKSHKKVVEILRDEISEAKYNIQYFIRTYGWFNHKQ